MQMKPALADALRRNRCKELQRQMRDELAIALDRDPESFLIADFQTSDRVWEIHQPAASQAKDNPLLYRTFVFSENQQQDVEELIQKLLISVPDEPCYLFRALSYDCGAFLMSYHDVFQNAFRLIELDQESVLAISASGQSCFGLGLFTDSTPAGKKIHYYLSVMGSCFLKTLEQE